jgi:hypothetical protein
MLNSRRVVQPTLQIDRSSRSADLTLVAPFPIEHDKGELVPVCGPAVDLNRRYSARISLSHFNGPRGKGRR